MKVQRRQTGNDSSDEGDFLDTDEGVNSKTQFPKGAATINLNTKRPASPNVE